MKGKQQPLELALIQRQRLDARRSHPVPGDGPASGISAATWTSRRAIARGSTGRFVAVWEAGLDAFDTFYTFTCSV